MKNQIFYLLLIYLTFHLSAFAQQEIEVYPNPFQDELFLIITPECGDSVKLELYNMTGVSLITGNTFEVSKPDTLRYKLPLDPGVYLLRYTRNEKEMAYKVIWNGGSAQAKINLVLSKEKLNCTNHPFEIFPNPSMDGLFIIRQPHVTLAYEVRVYDMAGDLIHHELVKDRQKPAFALDLSSQADGSYFIHIVSGQGVKVQKVLLLQEK